MKRIRLFAAVAAAFALSCLAVNAKGIPSQVKFTREALMDKIRGAWAGQVLGCTYGGPTEFKYNGMIHSDVPLPWSNDRVAWYFEHAGGLYDDVYMDLTFVDIFQKEGLDAPIESFAEAFANAPYPLWHANRQARYNILNGVMPPASGDWVNNPHADDIDFQIEADYAGIMAPGLVNAATYYTDAIGHMMNYGDGWYGGVYVAAMYSLAFVSSDINFVVCEALKTIPAESKFYKAMADVIKWHRKYPKDWEITWALVNKHYGDDLGCPDGVDAPFNIDAVINSAYIIIGLLYGDHSFYKTIDIATRCGQDSDCNPASAGGILGTMLGYSGIPTYWTDAMKPVSDIPFVYTDISFNKACEYSLSQALQVIERNGGKVSGGNIVIRTQKPQAVRYEKSFDGHYPKERIVVRKPINQLDGPVEFEGNGIVVTYHYYKGAGYTDHGHVGDVEVYLDGKLDVVARNPVSGNGSAAELFWKYNLPEGKHTVDFRFLNKEDNMNIVIDNYIVYSSIPREIQHETK